MTAATVTDRIDTNDPTREDVLLTATDADTYVSKKFATIRGVQATINEDGGALSIPITCAWTGGTVTLHCTGLSTQKVLLTILGRK